MLTHKLQSNQDFPLWAVLIPSWLLEVMFFVICVVGLLDEKIISPVVGMIGLASVAIFGVLLCVMKIGWPHCLMLWVGAIMLDYLMYS